MAGPAGAVLVPNSALKWLKQTFDEADKNGDGSLSIGEVLQLLHKLNVNLPRQRVKQMFKVRRAPLQVQAGAVAPRAQALRGRRRVCREAAPLELREVPAGPAVDGGGQLAQHPASAEG